MRKLWIGQVGLVGIPDVGRHTDDRTAVHGFDGVALPQHLTIYRRRVIFWQDKWAGALGGELNRPVDMSKTAEESVHGVSPFCIDDQGSLESLSNPYQNCLSRVSACFPAVRVFRVDRAFLDDDGGPCNPTLHEAKIVVVARDVLQPQDRG